MRYFVLILCLLCNATYGLIIDLYEEIGVNDLKVYLSKIGVITKEKTDHSSFNPSRIALLNLPKESIFFSADDIKKILISQFNIKSVTINGKGITIHPLYSSILYQEILEKIKREVIKKYPYISAKKIKIIFLKIPSFPKLPAGDWEYKISVPGGKINLTKYIRIQVKQDNYELVNLSVPIRILLIP